MDLPCAGRVVAAVTIHEMHHTRTMRRHLHALGQRLCEAHHPALLNERTGAPDFGCADEIERAAFVVVTPLAPRFLGHQLRASRLSDIRAASLSWRRWSLPVFVSGSSA